MIKTVHAKNESSEKTADRNGVGKMIVGLFEFKKMWVIPL